jgi:hypothetical protein
MSSLVQTILETTLLIGVFIGGVVILKTSLTPPQSVLRDSRFRNGLLQRGGKTRKKKN